VEHSLLRCHLKHAPARDHLSRLFCPDAAGHQRYIFSQRKHISIGLNFRKNPTDAG
jgi:hypothetical protein